ncbi:MAG: enoyl-CoA hydratase/isomerase family protein, partial [Nitrospinae bacterium]|nr:enoyl-CoA hydratase/isomerase family protein [Nitrospinota bacterium]
MNAPAFETLLFEVRGHVAIVSLNRPERLNAMNRVMLRELNEACDFIEAEDALFVAVLTGEGKSFSSGFDLKEQAENTPVGFAEWRRALRQDFDAVMRFWNLSKPTIAAVRGHALAGGCELALACDVTVAAEDAVFGEPELKFGAGIV